MLKIIKAKPNPSGKDRIGRILTPQVQLAGEWVDIQNKSMFSVDLKTVKLYHYAYRLGGGNGWVSVTGFTGTLPAGKIMRVHSGSPLPLNQMNPIDAVGADYHVFSNKDYVWNNLQSDHPRLWNTAKRQWIDQTSYDPFPAEGKILIRSYDKLI